VKAPEQRMRIGVVGAALIVDRARSVD